MSSCMAQVVLVCRWLSKGFSSPARDGTGPVKRIARLLEVAQGAEAGALVNSLLMLLAVSAAACKVVFEGEGLSWRVTMLAKSLSGSEVVGCGGRWLSMLSEGRMRRACHVSFMLSG